MGETTLVVQLDGCTVSASVLRVPGRDGRGAYVAEVVADGAVETTEFRPTVSDSRRDLAVVLARRGCPPQDTGRLRPRLVYGGAWATGELERQPGYDPRDDPANRVSPTELRRRFINLLWAVCPADWEVRIGDRVDFHGDSAFEVRYVVPRVGLIRKVCLDRDLCRAAERNALDQSAFDAKAAVLNLG